MEQFYGINPDDTKNMNRLSIPLPNIQIDLDDQYGPGSPRHNSGSNEGKEYFSP